MVAQGGVVVSHVSLHLIGVVALEMHHGFEVHPRFLHGGFGWITEAHAEDTIDAMRQPQHFSDFLELVSRAADHNAVDTYRLRCKVSRHAY